MGSWTDLDARYPPGALSPAAAFVAAFGHLAGASSVYAEGGGPAAFVGRWCGAVVPTQDVLERAERALAGGDVAALLAAAAPLLSIEQRRCLALNLLDAVLGRGAGRPARAERLPELLDGLGLPAGELRAYQGLILAKNDREIFAQ